MNGDLARRGTCLCLVCAHPHPYPLIIIIILGIVIFVTFVTIIIGNERCATHGTCLCLVCPPTPWKVQVCLTERPEKGKDLTLTTSSKKAPVNQGGIKCGNRGTGFLDSEGSHQ